MEKQIDRCEQPAGGPDVVRLSSEFDSRLADVWLFMFGGHAELVERGGEPLGWFLRMAYLRGYEDALTEPRRGALYLRLGMPAPPARRTRTPVPSPTGGPRR